MCPSPTAAITVNRRIELGTAEVQLAPFIECLVQLVDGFPARRPDARIVQRDPEVFCEWDGLLAQLRVVRGKTHKYQVRARAGVVLAVFALAHFDSNRVLLSNNLARAGWPGVRAADEHDRLWLETLFDRKGRVVPIVDLNVEEVFIRNGREGFAGIQVAGEGGVQEGGVVELDPIGQVGPGVGVLGEIRRHVAYGGEVLAEFLVAALPCFLLALSGLFSSVQGQQHEGYDVIHI